MTNFFTIFVLYIKEMYFYVIFSLIDCLTLKIIIL